jgi:hypothetical protein
MLFEKKDFVKELKKFYFKLKNKENFALGRFNDGEMLSMYGISMPAGGGEWNTNGEDAIYDIVRKELIEAFHYQDKGYYVGIPCSCCQGQNFYVMRTFSKQDDEHLTFGNLFVNFNYNNFVHNYFPLFNQREVILVANKNAKIENLPFKVEKFFPVNYNAWVDNRELLDEIMSFDFKNKLFLFSCGPFANILCHKLWEKNKENTYLDIGSTISPWINTDVNVRFYYQQGTEYQKQYCVWE